MSSPGTSRRSNHSKTTRGSSSGGGGSSAVPTPSNVSSSTMSRHSSHHRTSDTLQDDGTGSKDTYVNRLHNLLFSVWGTFVGTMEPFIHALRGASAVIFKMIFLAVVAGVVLSCIVAIASVSGLTFAASVRWFVLRGAPEDATIPLEFDSNFRVSEGLGREWLGRLSESVQQTIDAAVDEMPTSTPLSRRALRIKAETDDKDDPHHLHHHPSDTASLLQALLRGDSDGNDGNALVLEALSGGGGGDGGRGGARSSSSYKHQKENGGIDRLDGDLGIADLMESSRSSLHGRQRSHDGKAPPVLGVNTKRSRRSKQKLEEMSFLDRLWETALAPGSSRNFPFVEDTLPLDDELIRDTETDYATWGSTFIEDSYGASPAPPTLPTRADEGDINIGEDATATTTAAEAPSLSSTLPPNTCPLNPDATCESCHRKADRQSERSRELALELLHAKEKQTKLKLSVAARLVETAIKEGKSQHVVQAWSHVSGLVSELIRLRTKAESAVESSMVAKTTLQLTDLTTRGGTFSFLRKTSPRDNAPLSLHQPRYTLLSGTAYDIKVTLSARIHYRPDMDDPSISPSGLRDADCKHSIADSSANMGGGGDAGVLGWLWGWVGGERLWTVPHGNHQHTTNTPHDRCGASVVSFRDTQLVLQSGLVTSERKVLAESSEKTPIRSLPLFLEGSISSLINSGVLPSSLHGMGGDEGDVGSMLYRCTFGVLRAVLDWCVWCALLPIRTFIFIAGTAFQAACEAVLWFAFGWLRIGLLMADRVARFVLGVPQVAPSLLHHYLHMVPPHTLTTAATTLLGNNNGPLTTTTTQHGVNAPSSAPTIPLVGYAQDLVFSVASGFVPSSDLISQLASLELLVMKEVDSSSAGGSGSGAYPSKVSVLDAHVTFHASLQGIQYYFSEYPVSTFLTLAAIWGGFIGFGCLAAVGGLAALYYSTTKVEDGDIRFTHTKSPTSPFYAEHTFNRTPSTPVSRRFQQDPASHSSSSHTSDNDDDSYTSESGPDYDEVSTTDYNGSTTPATTTNNSTPAHGSAADLSAMVPGSNRVWTPRPVRSRGGSRREQDGYSGGVTSPNNIQEARWGDVTNHRLGSDQGWARRSEEPRRDDVGAAAAFSTPSQPRPAATGNFGGRSHQTKVTSPYSR